MGQGSCRNSLCPCGSGKKFKKCCMGKKPRTAMLTMDFKKPVIANAIRFQGDGGFELLSGNERLRPVNANWTVSYDRKKGPKTLLNIPAINNDKLYFGETALFQNFDEVLISDANTKECGKDRITVAQALWCRKEIQNTGGVTIDVLDVGQIIGRNIRFPEKEALVILIDSFVKSVSYDSNKQYGIIWDSEYDKHQAYNRGELPIIDGYYLPKNMTIIYASADSGKENLANQLVSDCDRLATKRLNRIQTDGIRECLL